MDKILVLLRSAEANLAKAESDLKAAKVDRALETLEAGKKLAWRIYEFRQSLDNSKIFLLQGLLSITRLFPCANRSPFQDGEWEIPLRLNSVKKLMRMKVGSPIAESNHGPGEFADESVYWDFCQHCLTEIEKAVAQAALNGELTSLKQLSQRVVEMTENLSAQK